MPPCRLRVREAAHRGVHLDPYLTWSPSEKQLLAMFLLRLLRGVKLTPSLCEAETFGNKERPRRAGVRRTGQTPSHGKAHWQHLGLQVPPSHSHGAVTGGSPFDGNVVRPAQSFFFLLRNSLDVLKEVIYNTV